MKTSKLKILFLILLSVVLVSLVSCIRKRVYTYSITYYVDNEIVELMPNSYQTNQTLTLPEYEVASGFVFDGWYVDSNRSIQVSNTKNFNSDVKLYGFTKENPTPLKSATNTLNKYYDGRIVGGLPSIGEPEILIIPITFSNRSIPNDYMDVLNKAFFGSSSETGWESLSSYYYKSSYGKLNIKGTILDAYATNNTTGYYDNLYRVYELKLDRYNAGLSSDYPAGVEQRILKDALAYYDNSIDFNDYDYDKDGYIDAVQMVYFNNYGSNDLWWAFCDTVADIEDVEFDGVKVGDYTFVSYNFFEDQLGDNKDIINTETIIHETGHLLGLDDYYDYVPTKGPLGGLGGFDMMDKNCGDHNSYSKALLGWIEPQIINEDTTITLNSFTETGEVIFIYREYQDSLFGEFISIELYTPTNLNEIRSKSNDLFTVVGVKILHVNATLNLETIVKSKYFITINNNGDAKNKLIYIVEADKDNAILNGQSAANSDLFQAKDVFDNYMWEDGTLINFSIVIDSITNNQATVTIDFK